jgi:hypothetical protein
MKPGSTLMTDGTPVDAMHDGSRRDPRSSEGDALVLVSEFLSEAGATNTVRYHSSLGGGCSWRESAFEAVRSTA